MAEQMVRYDNRMNQLNFKDFTEREMNLFFAIISKVKGNYDQIVELTYEQLFKMAQEKSRPTIEEFSNDLYLMNKKLTQLNCEFHYGSVRGMFILFPGFVVDSNEKILRVHVNKEFTYLFNKLNSEFTQFELREFIGLRGKYTKQLYRLLKQFRQSGNYAEKWNEFKELMDIPETYETREITRRILNPAIERIAKLPGFHDLSYEYSYRRKKIIRVAFEWTVVEDEFTHKVKYDSKESALITENITNEIDESENDNNDLPW